eukprot:848761-Prorocentrum_minimum.AAC.1
MDGACGDFIDGAAISATVRCGDFVDGAKVDGTWVSVDSTSISVDGTSVSVAVQGSVLTPVRLRRRLPPAGLVKNAQVFAPGVLLVGDAGRAPGEVGSPPRGERPALPANQPLVLLLMQIQATEIRLRRRRSIGRP